MSKVSAAAYTHHSVTYHTPFFAYLYIRSTIAFQDERKALETITVFDKLYPLGISFRLRSQPPSRPDGTQIL
jgi:hypothetical protein